MISAVDSNVLFDILLRDPLYAVQSRDRLRRAIEQGSLRICEIVAAEIAGFFEESADLQRFFQRWGIRVEQLSDTALFSAGHAWRQYARQRGTALACSVCGKSSQVICPECGERLRSRQHLIADFMIGAHALDRADQLITRDTHYYRTYFPELVLAN